MDGFHRRQDYLLSHTVSVNGREIPMVNIVIGKNGLNGQKEASCNAPKYPLGVN